MRFQIPRIELYGAGTYTILSVGLLDEWWECEIMALHISRIFTRQDTTTESYAYLCIK